MAKMKSLPIIFMTVIASCFSAASKEPEAQHALTMYGAPKYPAAFSSFAYVNSDAPKGGTLKIGAIGAFDALNPYSFKGIPVAGTGVLGENYLFDSLMIAPADEPETLYGLIAESVEMPEDRSWIIFNLNKKAKWPDGKPITSADVEFTVETLKEHGRPFMQSHYKKVSHVEILSPYRIKFTLKPQTDPLTQKPIYERDLPLLIARMVVLPKHILEGKDFHKLTHKDMIGSGPYRMKDVKMGHSVTYERRDDYWAKDLNVRKGLFNFQTVIYDYYRNRDVLFEAFKAEEFDFFMEIDPNRWKTAYNFPAVKEGRIKKLDLPHDRPVGMRAFVMNTRQPIFKNRDIRRALILAFDFEWVNHNLCHNIFTRNCSYFDNTTLASKGLPSSEEKKLLEPFKDSLPQEVMTQSYTLPTFTTPLERRKTLAQAQKLLKQAGCVMKNGKLIHPLTHKPFKFQIMITRVEEEKLALAFKRDLKPLGIDVSVQLVDEPQYWARTQKFDFDMVIFLWTGSFCPSSGVLLNRWGTQSATQEGSLNYMGCAESAIDALCGEVAKAQTWDDLKIATKSLDRVLLWGHYVIPLFYDKKNHIAIWDKFGYPEFNPLVGLTTTTWWFKEARQKKKT